MSRQFLWFCRSMPFSREQAGMAFAIAAVACLSSVIAHWSQQYPGSVGERQVRPLFGDLTEQDSTASSPEPTNSQRQDVRVTHHSSTQEPEAFSEREANWIETASQRTQTTSSSDSLITVVQFTELAEDSGSQAHSVDIRPPDVEEAAWLSGGIEGGVTDENRRP